MLCLAVMNDILGEYIANQPLIQMSNNKQLKSLISTLIPAIALISVNANAFGISDIENTISQYGNTNTTQHDIAADHFLKTNFPKNFYTTKLYLKKLARQQGFGETIYDNCKITFHGKKLMSLKPDLSTCNYKIRNFRNKFRAERTEAEHIVPISWIGHQLQCWKHGGRKNCERTSSAFNHAEANLVNLQWAVGEVNADRSDYRYANKLDSGFDYGSNGRIVINKQDRRFQPPAEFHGWFGRVHLYMQKMYGFKMSKSYQAMIEVWAKEPATKRECQYNARLQKDFGSSNPLTTKMCSSHFH